MDAEDETRPTASALQEALNDIPRRPRRVAVMVTLLVACATAAMIAGVLRVTEPGWTQTALLIIAIGACGFAGLKFAGYLTRRRGPDALDRWIEATPDQSQH